MAKYIWGDEPMNMKWAMGFMVISGLLVGFVLTRVGTEAAVGVAYPAPADLHGAALVTCFFSLMLYTFYGNQILVAFTPMPDKVKEQAKMIADRSVGNAMEQAFPFLSLLWLHAIFVNPQSAKVLGSIYVVFRYFYPIFYGIFGKFNTMVEVSTQCNYVIIFYFFWTVLVKCFSGKDLQTEVTSTSEWLMLLVGVACGLSSFVVFLLGAAPSFTAISKGVKKDMGVVDEEEELEEGDDEEMEDIAS